MVFKIFKSLLGKDYIYTPDNNNENGQKQIDLLNQISNGLGEYASCAFNEQNSEKKNEKAQEMLSNILNIERNSMGVKNSQLFYLIAIAYRNYCAWFIRGSERKKYLKKCEYFLDKSISLAPNNIDAQSELGRLLIEEKVIRDISRGINILESLDDKGVMPSHLNSILAKARRQIGDIERRESFNLCAFKDPSPGVFREERKRFRALIRNYKKQNEIDKLKIILNQYYSLAVLVTICYGDHDCNSAVAGKEYDEAVKIVQEVCNKIDYAFSTHGYLEQSNFISKNDWKTFVSIFGENTKSFNPVIEFKK